MSAPLKRWLSQESMMIYLDPIGSSNATSMMDLGVSIRVLQYVMWQPCMTLPGKEVAQSPRAVLKAQVAEAKKRGYVLKSGVEALFISLF